MTLNNNTNGVINAQIKNNQTLLNINNTGTINSTTLTNNGNNQINIVFGANIKTDTYEETGIGPMNMHVESEDYNSVKTMLGLKAKKEYKLDNGMVVKPELHFRWYHELADTNGGVNAYFLAQQELFGANGIDAPRDMGDIAFRLTTENDERLDIFVESFYQFGKDFYNIGGTVGLKYNF